MKKEHVKIMIIGTGIVLALGTTYFIYNKMKSKKSGTTTTTSGSGMTTTATSLMPTNLDPAVAKLEGQDVYIGDPITGIQKYEGVANLYNIKGGKKYRYDAATWAATSPHLNTNPISQELFDKIANG